MPSYPGADPGFGNEYTMFVWWKTQVIADPNSRASYIYERSEYKSAGGPRIFFEFRTPESESERNLTNYFIIFFVTFLLRIFWKIFFMIIELISFRYLKIIMKQSTIFVNPIHKK